MSRKRVLWPAPARMSAIPSRAARPCAARMRWRPTPCAVQRSPRHALRRQEGAVRLAAADAERRDSADSQHERERMAASSYRRRTFSSRRPTEPNWRPRSCHISVRESGRTHRPEAGTNAHERVGRYASRRRRTDCRTPLASTPRARRSAVDCQWECCRPPARSSARALEWRGAELDQQSLNA